MKDVIVGHALWRAVVCSLVLSSTIFWAADPARAQEPALELPQITLAQNQEGDMPVVARDIPEPGLAGYEILLEFNPALLRIEEVLPGDPPWGAPVANVNNEEGTVTATNAMATGESGTFTLFTLRVTALGTGGDIAGVTVTPVTMASADLEDIEVTVQDGQVVISGDPVDTPEPAPGETPAVEATPTPPAQQVPGAAPPPNGNEGPDEGTGWLLVALVVIGLLSMAAFATRWFVLRRPRRGM